MVAPLLVLPEVEAEVILLLDVGAVVAAAEAAAGVIAGVLQNLRYHFEGAHHHAHLQGDEGAGLAAAVGAVPEADRRHEV